MKKGRIVVIVIAAVLMLLYGAAYGYFAQHGMKAVPGHEQGLPSLPQHVLIATQGSGFKDGLVVALLARLQQRPSHVKVIDVAGLAAMNGADWQAIVIVHSWEFGRPPRAVEEFVARLADSGKIIDVTTSGSGREKLAGVDVISSASVMDEIPDLAARLESRIDARLPRR